MQYRNPPNIFIQAHCHVHETSSMRADPFVIAAPCMKLPGEYEERIDVDDGDYGGMYFVCKDSEVIDFEPMLKVPKGIGKWSLK